MTVSMWPGTTSRDQILSIFQGVSPSEMEMMFDRDGNLLRVKAEFREGITWHIGDAGDTQLRDFLGPQDIELANRFLRHMGANDAEACLRSLVRLVKPGGYLFVSGVDSSVRSKVAQELHWEPVLELIREVHEGDPSLRHDEGVRGARPECPPGAVQRIVQRDQGRCAASTSRTRPCRS